MMLFWGMEQVRQETKTELEKTVPAADADVIIESALRDATRFGGGRGRGR